MKNTIFVKYSNQRDDRYKIKTVISEDETGNRYVEKYPLTKAAKVHIEQIAEYGKQLEDIAADTKFTFNNVNADTEILVNTDFQINRVGCNRFIFTDYK